MSVKIVVLGAGYAGAEAIRNLEEELDEETADLVWVSKRDYHEVIHEAHRCIRKPELRETIQVPIDEIKSERTRFVEGTVTGVDVDEQTVELEDETDISYDYCVICLGTQTAFYDIDGLENNAHTMKSVEDGLAINEALGGAVEDATEDDPARAIVGGGGLTGIQTAGEIAAYRDVYDAPLEVMIVQESDQIFPGHDHEFQGSIQQKLERKDVELNTGKAVTRADGSAIYLGDDEEQVEYDVLVWCGGVTGRDALSDADLDKDHNRVYADSTFKSSDPNVFAIGDGGLVKQSSETGPLTEEKIWEQVVHPDIEDGQAPPPTAEAAWEEAKHLGQNVARYLSDKEPIEWGYTNKGTMVSIGDMTVAHGVLGVPVNTFSGPVADQIKKGITVRWLNDVASSKRAFDAWRAL